jgi:hypothetical protein
MVDPSQRRWKSPSARKQNSSGATGHLMGMSTTLTTRRPSSTSASASASAVCPGECVEGKHTLHPPGPDEPVGLPRHQGGSGGNDEDVVGEGCSMISKHHAVVPEVNPLHRHLQQSNTAVQLVLARTHQLVPVGEAERNEEQPWLVEVFAVLVDDGKCARPRGRGHGGAGWQPVCRPVPAPRMTMCLVTP